MIGGSKLLFILKQEGIKLDVVKNKISIPYCFKSKSDSLIFSFSKFSFLYFSMIG